MQAPFKQVNFQPITKFEDTTGAELLVHSIFYTFQGEGPFSGRPAVFIRLGGCNLQCPGCDTEYTNGSKRLLLSEICQQVYEKNPKFGGLIVITGGEPFRQNITPLVTYLCKAGYTVQIETNGTLPPPNGFEACKNLTTWGTSMFRRMSTNCYIVVSPKTGKVNRRTEELAVAYKYVVDARSVSPADGLPFKALGHTAVPHVARPPHNFRGPIYLQPADINEFQNAANLECAKEMCMQFGYTLQIQIHKVIGVE